MSKITAPVVHGTWIKKETLLEQIKLRYIAYFNTAQNAKAETCANVINEINNAPTFDAVPVVRCKDCKYGTEMSGNIICHQPKHNEYETDIRSFDWFCADGERRAEDG